MGVGKSRVDAKRCSCDELAKSDSLNAVIRTRVSCRSTDSKNQNRNSSKPRDATKKRSLQNKNDYHKFPNKHEPSSMRRMNKNNECQCYTALKGQRYSVDALTPEEQFEEVEKMFREKKSGRAPTQFNRRSAEGNQQVSSASARESAGNASAMGSLTDNSRAYEDDSPSLATTRRRCNPDCRCGESKSSAQTTLEIERRNGLQKVGHSNAGCQCVLYDGRVGRLHEAELSQAQAIAIAVREYCAQRRKSGRGHGHYCLCSKDVLPKPQWQEDEELERESQRKNEEKNLGIIDLMEVEDETEGDIVKREEEAESGRVGNVELQAETDERRKSRAEDDEPFADEHREHEKYLPETRRRLHDSEQIDPESGKRSRRRKETNSREYANEDAYSLSDVELQVQTVVSTTEDNPRHAPTKPQSRQPPNDVAARRASDAKDSSHRHEQQRLSTLTADEKECKCCLCGTKEIETTHEEEVLVKKTNLSPRSPRSPHEVKSESTKPKREHPSGRRESEELRAGRVKRRVSAESTNESSSQEEDCRCCDCDKATMTDWTDVDRRTKPDKREHNADNNFDNRLTNDHEPRHKEYGRRARRSTENETEHERVKNSKDKWEPKDAYAAAAAHFNKEGHKKREKSKRKCCCRSSDDGDEKDFKLCCPCNKDGTTASGESHSDERTESESDSAHKMHSTERVAGRSAERKSPSNRQRKKSNASDGDRRRSPVRRRSRSKSEKECQTYCRCKKTKGVPLTKCCKCHEELAFSAAHEQDEDLKRRKLAEELADRIQKRAELQIALQKRLQEQRRAMKKQCCCCDPPPCCYPQYKCCEMRAPEPMSCYEAMQSSPCNCCPATPCCPTTPCCPATPCCPPTSCCPPCCCEPPPCFGQDCPCCCQPLKYCYPPSCIYPRTGL